MEIDYKALTEEFVRYEKIRGTRSLRKIPYELKAFYSFMDEEGLEIERLKYQDCVRFQTYLSTLPGQDGCPHYATSTVSSIFNTTKCLYEFLKMKKRIITNPFYGVKPVKVVYKIPQGIPTEKKMDSFLSDLRTFWKAERIKERRFNYRTHVIAELLYSSGLRLSELASLKETDIDFEGHLINVKNGKGGKERTAYLTEYAVRVLKIYITEMRDFIVKNESENLFGVKSGRHLDRALNSRLRKAALKNNIPDFTSHKFRHTIGFHLLRRGCDMRFIQIILGHESMSSTSIYTHVDKKDLKKELDTFHPRKWKGEKSNEKD